MSDVFISYARANERAARRIAEALRSRGMEIWSDDQLPAHRAYSEIIEQRLQQAKAVVVLWSKQAAQSQWVRAEADYARNAGKLVQAQLDDQLPPMPFNQIQCASLKGWRGSDAHAGWSKLVDSIGELVSGQAPQRSGTAARGKRPGPKLWWIAAAATLLIAALLIVPRLMDRAEAERPVLAVLPFESLDQRDASLVAGIWEDTRQALSKNPQLLVLGPNTSEQLAQDAKTAGRAADYLVEASVRSAGDRVRVSANLIRTKDSAQIWSESFERPLNDVFQLQQQIAGEIEGRIRGRLAERGGTLPQHIVTSGELYALYSEARAHIRNRRIAKYREAEKQLQQVVRRDPNFAPGWATLAVAQTMLATGKDGASAPETAARRAIALAPNLATGHAALGFALGREGPAAKAALERALKLDPNDIEAMNWLANALLQEGRRGDALTLQNRILEIEPLWWPAIYNKITGLAEIGDLAAAGQEVERLEKLGNLSAATMIRMDVARRKGDLSTAVILGVERYRAASPREREMIAPLLFMPMAQLQMFDAMDRLQPPPTAWIPYIRRNDPKAIDMFEAQLAPKRFWTFGDLAILGGRLYLQSGQAPRLARQYHAAAESPEEFVELVGKDRIALVAPIAALALRLAGSEAEARRLLELALANSQPRASNLDGQVDLARIYAVQGRTDEAIGLLSLAISRGWLPPWLPIHVDIALDPPLNELRGDPRFEKLRQRILAHLDKERKELGPVTLD